MGFPFGDGLYGKGLYSRRPDWWRGRACGQEGWQTTACGPSVWTPTPPPAGAWTPALGQRRGAVRLSGGSDGQR